MTDQENIEQELLSFLNVDARDDLKSTALSYFLGLTASAEGSKFITSTDRCLETVAKMICDKNPSVIENALLTLVNLSSDMQVCVKLLNLDGYPHLLLDLLRKVIDRDSDNADTTCLLLNNLSRMTSCAGTIVTRILENSDVGLPELVQAFSIQAYNTKGATLHFLGPFLANLTQVGEARSHLLDKSRGLIQKLLPFTQFVVSEVRRRGAVAILKNCCFNDEYHRWLLSDEVDILPHLLLPLAGPEEFDEDEMNKLPDDLQYLEPSKEREPLADVRKMLIEALSQLCATKYGRKLFQEKNAYIILRELHKWEDTKENKLAIENVVAVLLEEPTTEHSNLKEVEVDEAHQKMFDNVNKEYLTQGDID